MAKASLKHFPVTGGNNTDLFEFFTYTRPILTCSVTHNGRLAPLFHSSLLFNVSWKICVPRAWTTTLNKSQFPALSNNGGTERIISLPTVIFSTQSLPPILPSSIEINFFPSDRFEKNEKLISGWYVGEYFRLFFKIAARIHPSFKNALFVN